MISTTNEGLLYEKHRDVTYSKLNGKKQDERLVVHDGFHDTGTYMTGGDNKLLTYKSIHQSRMLLSVGTDTHGMFSYDFRYFGRHRKESHRTHQRRKEIVK